MRIVGMMHFIVDSRPSMTTTTFSGPVTKALPVAHPASTSNPRQVTI
jgi:hypothetical protein